MLRLLLGGQDCRRDFFVIMRGSAVDAWETFGVIDASKRRRLPGIVQLVL